MSLLDTRTLVFSDMIINIVCLLVILFLWRQGRKRFAGLGYWVLDFAFQTIAFFLITFYSNVPMSMVLGRTLMIAGTILGYIGLGRFVGKGLRKFTIISCWRPLSPFRCISLLFNPTWQREISSFQLGHLLSTFNVHGF